VIREIRASGLPPDDFVRSELSRAFFGPVSLEEIVKLLALGEAEDVTAGSGRYGQRWRVPLSHQARAILGDRLAVLGDRRPGVGLREDGLPDIDWCRIEGGEAKKTPRMPFSMARYPVTIHQFKAFVEACYVEDYWYLPGFSAGYLVPPPRHEGRHGNYPADSVSWYHAMAFCHWLSACLEAEIRLPTELEWQLAASGGDPKRIYPWGRGDPQQEPWRANTSESDLRRPTAVGLYPLGASKAGLLDMAGTIGEWCLNARDDPSGTISAKGGGYRGLRGGSWLSLQDDACCAKRSSGEPNLQAGDIGFRVVCSSPIIDWRSLERRESGAYGA
jgi:hypothetical protein